MKKSVYSIIQWIYNQTARSHLPKKIGVLNGVAVRRPRILDINDVNYEYEAELVSFIRESVSPGDNVVIVGGGYGVTATVAAKEGAEVIVYEGSRQQVEKVNETVRLNCMSNRVRCEAAIVGEPVDVWGESTDRMIKASDLPECDVLELDCEGAEEEILSGLSHLPDTVIVEAHEYLGSPPSVIRNMLINMGYNIVGEKPEDEERGIVVFHADLGEND